MSIQLKNTQLKYPLSGSFTGSFTGSFIGDGSGLTNLPGQSINTSSFATTGSNTFKGTQTITGSNGKLIYTGTAPLSYPTLAEIHANDDYPWLERFYNDTFSTSSAIMAYFGWNDGRFVFHNESTQSIGLQVNGFGAENGLLVYSDKVAFVNNVEVTGSLNVVGGITGSFTGSFAGDGSQLTGIVSSKWSGTNPITRTSDVEITGSLRVTNSITASLFGTASFAQTAAVAPNYLPLTGGTITGSLTINNNLTVLGSASIQYISESTLNIGTNLITVNTLNPGARFGGLAVIDSGSLPQVSASFLYDSVQDEFIFVHKGTAASAITSSHFLVGPETYNDVGNELYLIANRIPKSVGNEHLNDSNISDNGSVVSINSNTQITGSLLVTAGITGSFSGSGANLSNIPSSAITGLNLNQISSGSVSASISPNNGLQINTNVTATSFTGSLFGTSSFATSASYVNVTQSLGFTPEDVANKTTSTSLGTSNTLYPSQNAVKSYVDTAVNSAVLSPASKLFNYYNFI